MATNQQTLGSLINPSIYHGTTNTVVVWNIWEPLNPTANGHGLMINVRIFIELIWSSWSNMKLWNVMKCYDSCWDVRRFQCHLLTRSGLCTATGCSKFLILLGPRHELKPRVLDDGKTIITMNWPFAYRDCASCVCVFSLQSFKNHRWWEHKKHYTTNWLLAWQGLTDILLMNQSRSFFQCTITTNLIYLK